ncbi:MAG TPA: hypothetical protein VFO95_04400 [Gemmatimonadales bacterium]|nr:hypothetical protein [Gemmatimonadales bacterium]
MRQRTGVRTLGSENPTVRPSARPTVLFLAGLLVLSSAPLAAQAGSPSGTELHNRHIEAVGGKSAIEKITARRAWGRFEVPAQGMSGPVEIAAAAPARMWFKVEIPGIGESVSGFDGETAWSMNPAMGPMVVDGLQLNQIKQQADFHGDIHPERHITSREAAGEAEYDGKKCWSVTVKTTWGESYQECYDKASGLMIAMVRKQSTPMGEVEATTLLSEYKTFDGVKMPVLTKISVMGIDQVLTIDSVSTRAIPDSVFALPAAIKALKK